MRILLLHHDPAERARLTHELAARGHAPVAVDDVAQLRAAARDDAPEALALVDDGALARDELAALLADPRALRGVVVLADPAELGALLPHLAPGRVEFVPTPCDPRVLAARVALAERALADARARGDADRVTREALERLEAFERAAFEGLGLLEHGALIATNHALPAMLGYAPEEMLGRSVLDFAAPESRAVILANIRAGSEQPYEALALRKDGGTFPAELRGCSVTYQGRRVRVTSALDITERKAAEAAVRASEESLAATLESIGDAVIATDAQGRVARMNPVAEGLTGWTLAEARGRPLEEVFAIFNEETGERAVSPVSTVLRDGVVVGLANHTELVARDGSRRPIADSGAPIRDKAGAITGVVLVFRDMSVEQRASQAVLRSQREFRELIESVPDGVAIHREGRLVFVNRALVSILGYASRAELLGRAAQDVLGFDAGALEPSSNDALTTGVFQPLREVRARRADGQAVTLEVAPGPAVVFEGHAAALVMVRDVSERKRMQARLHMSDRMVSIGTLAAGVAHEINNPLAFATANLSYVAQQLARLGIPASDARLRRIDEAVREAQDGVTRVGQIVRDLKTLSRGDDDQRGEVDVRAALEMAIHMANNEIRHRAQLVRDFADVPLVDANAGRLGQVFLNLLINAAQAIPEGAADRNEIRVSTRRGPDGRAVVEVRDTGHGISRESIGRIFEPFFTTKPMGEGTGLGLSICHGIITSLGGEITVESERGRGTVFRVSLPPAVPGAGAHAGAVAERPAAPRRGRVLVIDDEPMIGLSIQRILEDEHDVVALTQTRAALERVLSGERFDVILCDLMMPQMTGMDFYEALAQRAPALVHRVVFLTGGAFTARARDFLESVSNARLEKPFAAEELERLVRARVSE